MQSLLDEPNTSPNVPLRGATPSLIPSTEPLLTSSTASAPSVCYASDTSVHYSERSASPLSGRHTLTRSNTLPLQTFATHLSSSPPVSSTFFDSLSSSAGAPASSTTLAHPAMGALAPTSPLSSPIASPVLSPTQAHHFSMTSSQDSVFGSSSTSAPEGPTPASSLHGDAQAARGMPAENVRRPRASSFRLSSSPTSGHQATSHIKASTSAACYSHVAAADQSAASASVPPAVVPLPTAAQLPSLRSVSGYAEEPRSLPSSPRDLTLAVANGSTAGVATPVPTPSAGNCAYRGGYESDSSSAFASSQVLPAGRLDERPPVLMHTASQPTVIRRATQPKSSVRASTSTTPAPRSVATGDVGVAFRNALSSDPNYGLLQNPRSASTGELPCRNSDVDMFSNGTNPGPACASVPNSAYSSPNSSTSSIPHVSLESQQLSPNDVWFANLNSQLDSQFRAYQQQVQALIGRLSLENAQLKHHVSALEFEVRKLSETNQELGSVLRTMDKKHGTSHTQLLARTTLVSGQGSSSSIKPPKSRMDCVRIIRGLHTTQFNAKSPKHMKLLLTLWSSNFSAPFAHTSDGWRLLGFKCSNPESTLKCLLGIHNLVNMIALFPVETLSLIQQHHETVNSPNSFLWASSGLRLALVLSRRLDVASVGSETVEANEALKSFLPLCDNTRAFNYVFSLCMFLLEKVWELNRTKPIQALITGTVDSVLELIRKHQPTTIRLLFAAATEEYGLDIALPSSLKS
mmetsp:Transcript_20954/g.53068  ORF Transcript_20954/g.53068 Transcript_20954/m.53068 type:complete len:746 (-) Transcript_20954:95-2332(-)|eukprot:CAMPEP_0177652704 /NCGR_PEP_ID=MMETSP0447-20121125/13283_1 /TAXON_ID=0 /ORGANISM="Stygamoeba regulata, Strain BSH-02190019" /LENGTH=745 /DNA_ID=CAMNT_0019155989 /DNA_START=231 /DNA_END=2468 /DNA_ORIENTATION=-